MGRHGVGSTSCRENSTRQGAQRHRWQRTLTLRTQLRREKWEEGQLSNDEAGEGSGHLQTRELGLCPTGEGFACRGGTRSECVLDSLTAAWKIDCTGEGLEA